MLASLLILLIIPLVDFCRIRGAENRPLMRFLVFFFGALFILLLNLGSKHVEAPYVLLGQIGTVLYFS
jgi:ubiquinol-cytochrome c reductase cytochrome b subunit